MPPEPSAHRVDLVSRAGIGLGLPDGFVPHCPGCRYDLTGLSQSRCPECGRPFSIPALIQAWHDRRAAYAQAQNADALLVAFLAFFAFLPVSILDPWHLLWKVPLLVGMWWMTAVCYQRRAEALRDPTDGHRLLWVWIPCLATVIGVSPTPVLNLIVAVPALTLGIVATVAAFRRSPMRTAIVLTIVAAAPAAIMAVVAVSMVLFGMAGAGQGHHWSSADFPSWYWRGRAGRVRGMNNHEAIQIGGVILCICIAVLVAIAGMWVGVACPLVRRGMARLAQARGG